MPPFDDTYGRGGARYSHANDVGTSHTPSTHDAYESHTLVALMPSHGCPSGMTTGQTPVPSVGHWPTRQNGDSVGLHGSPEPAHVIGAQTPA
jgi:hypothetical protein